MSWMGLSHASWSGGFGRRLDFGTSGCPFRLESLWMRMQRTCVFFRQRWFLLQFRNLRDYRFDDRKISKGYVRSLDIVSILIPKCKKHSSHLIRGGLWASLDHVWTMKRMPTFKMSPQQKLVHVGNSLGKLTQLRESIHSCGIRSLECPSTMSMSSTAPTTGSLGETNSKELRLDHL